MSESVPTAISDLISVIDSRVKKVHTTTLDLSFNELFDMFKGKELNISPEFQRLFQWSEGARSRFIESLLLEMPVPPIYVIEQDDGKYVLIDGLQRISSYLHMRGELDAPHLDPAVQVGQKLKLTDCDIVKELNGRTFDDLGTALQIRLKRAFVNVKVVRKGSDPRFQYYMFKRLNTGGERLSEQQIRNCTIRLLNPKFNDFIIELSKDANFKRCIETLTLDRLNAAFDQELVLRFFAFKNDLGSFSHDVSDFLTEYMEKVSDAEKGIAFDYEAERGTFKKTFELLAITLEDVAFSYANRDATKLTKGFSVYHYEAITIGMQPHVARLDVSSQDQMTSLKEALRGVKLNSDFITATTGGGKNSPGPLNQRIGFVRDAIAGVP